MNLTRIEWGILSRYVKASGHTETCWHCTRPTTADERRQSVKDTCTCGYDEIMEMLIAIED